MFDRVLNTPLANVKIFNSKVNIMILKASVLKIPKILIIILNFMKFFK